jgi:RNA polymerase sigma-70 factor (ECF subfamily)
MTTQRTDGWLVARVQNGDLEALGKLYEKYKAQVYRTALAITRDEKTAEDILQEAFLRIYTYADSFDKTRPLGPWLYRMTVNLAYSWTSQAKRWVNLFQEALDSLTAPARQHPEEIVEKRGQQQFLRQAIDTLPEPQRVVIILHYLEELSVSEIAYAVGIPEGTVKSRLYYARERLKKTILEQGYGAASEVAYDFT